MDEPLTSPRKPRGRRRTRWLRSLGLLVLFIGVWYGVDRGLAMGRIVRIIEDRAVEAMESVAGASSGTASTGVRTLRIGTWNIAHGRGLHSRNFTGESTDERRGRVAAIADLLAEQQLDLIILNEVDFDSSWSGRLNHAEFIARIAGFRWRVEQRNVDASVPFIAYRFGNAVLSRYPIVAVEVVDFRWPNRWQPLFAGKKRGCIATIELPDGSRLQVAPIHLDHRWGGTETRTQSLRCLLEAADPGLPLVAAGDFNTALPGFPGVRAQRLERTALSIFMEEGMLHTLPTSDPQPEDLTFRSTSPDRVIDWIVVPRAWSIVSRHVLPTDLSDHRPVILEVEFE